MSPKIIDFPGNGAEHTQPQSEQSEQEQPAGALYKELTDLCDGLLGLDDTSLARMDIGRDQLQLGSTNQLEIRQGNDGTEGHQAILHIPPRSEEGRKYRDYISINTLTPRERVRSDGEAVIDRSVRVLWVRSGGENPQRHLLTMFDDGHVQGVPTREDDPYQELSGSRHLSREEIEELASGIIEMFGEEKSHREYALSANTQEVAS